jgi:hypothetical protein
MTSPRDRDGAVARHRIANLLHTYTDISDRKDVESGVALLGRARVRFPAGGSEDPEQARAFFTRLWGAPEPHRHDVSNLVVEPGDIPGTWTARAHYTRWVFEPEPALHTLGEYTLTVDGREWAITELTVTRTWTRA